jgi:hypothetical protein
MVENFGWDLFPANINKLLPRVNKKNLGSRKRSKANFGLVIPRREKDQTFGRRYVN